MVQGGHVRLQGAAAGAIHRRVAQDRERQGAQAHAARRREGEVSMRALLCRDYGPIERLKVEDVPSPRPGAGEVIVEVKASSLNYPDALLVQGLYQVKPPLPFSPGHEIAGVVSKLGEGVAGIAAGDAVIGTPGVGGFAEQCLVPRERLTPLPAGMDF